MGNSRFSFKECAQLQGPVKHKMQQEQDHEDCHTAWLEAENELASGRYDEFSEGFGVPLGYHQISNAAPKPRVAEESPATPRKRCLVHREVIHFFKDCSWIAACRHSFCNWGYGHEKSEHVKFTRRHSDGSPSGTYAFDLGTIPTVEPTDDGEGVTEVDEEHTVEVEELTVAAHESVRVAGDDSVDDESFDDTNETSDEPDDDYAEYEDETA